MRKGGQEKEQRVLSTLSGPLLRDRRGKKGLKKMFYLPGWAFYSAVIGVGLTFICAVISGQAEKSTASDKVQDKMNEGKTLICLAWNEKNWGTYHLIDAFWNIHASRFSSRQKMNDERKCQIILLPLGRKNEWKKEKRRKFVAGPNWGSRSVILLDEVIKFLLGRRVFLIIPEMNLCQLILPQVFYRNIVL